MITLVFGLVVLIFGFIGICTVNYGDLPIPMAAIIIGIGLCIGGFITILFT